MGAPRVLEVPIKVMRKTSNTGQFMTTTLIRYFGGHVKNPRQARSFAHLLRGAVARGWRSVLVCSRPPDELAWLDPLHEAGAQIVYLPRPRRNFDLACVRRAYALCRRWDCSVFHCDNMHTSPMIGATLAHVPVRIWIKRSMQPAYEKRREATWRERMAPSVRCTACLATRVLTVSTAVRDELASLGMSGSKVEVFLNPIDPASLRVAERAASRAAFGLGVDDLVVGTIGHAVPVKAWDVLVRAFSQVAAQTPHARLLLVGSTTAAHERECFAQLEALVAELGLEGRVIFPGYQTDLAPVYGALDVFVLPSRSEGNSNALLQALSVGLPCIATRVGHALQLIHDGENGLLVERSDVDELAATLARLVLDPARRARISAAARARSYAPSLDEYAERLVNLYASLLRERAPHRLDTVRSA